eukprot:TRINITY_DN15429_c1_g1_i1.p1 TRINITY_DN15429_c1_g1~~TRINITY_DN15429_c1_g1_i1.p1  ORF type:complete len:456 (-),score=43.99 TRINITY_DN15429_c1_g1_i1:480-1847(-)
MEPLSVSAGSPTSMSSGLDTDEIASENICGRPRSRTSNWGCDAVDDPLVSLAGRPRSRTLDTGVDGTEPCKSRANPNTDSDCPSGATSSSAYPNQPSSGGALPVSMSSQATSESTLSANRSAAPPSQIEPDAKPNPIGARKPGKKKTVGFGKRYSKPIDSDETFPEGRRISEVEAQKQIQKLERFQAERRMLGLDEEECMDSMDLFGRPRCRTSDTGCDEEEDAFGRPRSQTLDAELDGEHVIEKPHARTLSAEPDGDRDLLETSCGRPLSRTLDTGLYGSDNSQDTLRGRPRSTTLDTRCNGKEDMQSDSVGQLTSQALDTGLNGDTSMRENMCRRPRSQTVDLGCDVVEVSLDNLFGRPRSRTLDTAGLPGTEPCDTQTNPSADFGYVDEFLVDARRPPRRQQTLEDFLNTESCPERSTASSKDVGQIQCLDEFLEDGTPAESLDRFLSPNTH